MQCHNLISFSLNKIQLKMCSILWKRLTPFSPFFNLSSMKSERYSGDRELRLRKYSKSPAIVCLKSRSLLKDSRRKRSKRDLRSSKPCRQGRKNKRSSRVKKKRYGTWSYLKLQAAPKWGLKLVGKQSCFATLKPETRYFVKDTSLTPLKGQLSSCSALQLNVCVKVNHKISLKVWD